MEWRGGHGERQLALKGRERVLTDGIQEEKFHFPPTTTRTIPTVRFLACANDLLGGNPARRDSRIANLIQKQQASIR